ncbi:MAG: DUF1294 domain-containing protein [Eubacteriaceae bacterium]|nr:DUF1294 domain-containing protein [Eubacteriaceae bacterium]
MNQYEILICWNAAVFLLYGFDKLMAVKKMPRISEWALLFTAACMGALGALLGMKVFHHKIKNKKFVAALPLLLFANILLVLRIYLMQHAS